MNAERCLILGLAALGPPPLYAIGVPLELVAPYGADPLEPDRLVAGAECAQRQEHPPVLVVPAVTSVVEAVLDCDDVSRAYLLVAGVGQAHERRELEGIPFREWPRVGAVDLEFCPPRMVSDAPGDLRLVGGLGLICVGVAGPAPAAYVPIAEILPEMRSAAFPPRVAAHELDAAQASERRCQEDLAGARTAISDLQRSPSWQITAPLRAAKAALRSRRA